MNRYVVIPSACDRATLLPLVAEAAKIATVVLVHTTPSHAPVKNTVTVRDHESLSIQHWWNAGLDQCDGPTLVLNDDIVANAASLEPLFQALEAGADVVYLAGHRQGHATPLTGWCYGLWPDRIRPDEAFGWWAGDDDLYHRAVDAGMKVEAVYVPAIKHERMAAAFGRPEHAAMVDADMKLLHERWGSTVNDNGAVRRS